MQENSVSGGLDTIFVVKREKTAVFCTRLYTKALETAVFLKRAEFVLRIEELER